MTAFMHSYYLPKKFGIDNRDNSISASVRSGQISRENGLREYFETQPFVEADLLNYFKILFPKFYHT